MKKSILLLVSILIYLNSSGQGKSNLGKISLTVLHSKSKPLQKAECVKHNFIYSNEEKPSIDILKGKFNFFTKYNRISVEDGVMPIFHGIILGLNSNSVAFVTDNIKEFNSLIEDLDKKGFRNVDNANDSFKYRERDRINVEFSTSKTANKTMLSAEFRNIEPFDGVTTRNDFYVVMLFEKKEINLKDLSFWFDMSSLYKYLCQEYFRVDDEFDNR